MLLRLFAVLTTVLAILVAAPPALAQAPAPGRVELPPKPDLVDRSTPRRSLDGFLRASRAGDRERAAQFLDLRAIPKSRQAQEGPVLAGRLALVLGWTLVLDTAKLSDDPDGDPSDGPGSDLVGTVQLAEDAVPIALTRTRLDDGAQAWLVSKTTVAMVPALYGAHGGRWIGERMPAALRVTVLDLAAWQWIGLALSAVLGYAIGWLAGSVVVRLAMLIARRTKTPWDDELVTVARGPLRLALGAVSFGLLVQELYPTATARLVIDRIRDTLLVYAVAWLVIRFLHVGASSLHARLPEDTVGEMKSRGVRTQLAVLRRVATILVGLIAAAAVLTQFDEVRSVGNSLLASAGIAGIVLGVAAQKTLGAVIAGIQVSFTQPLRIGDTVTIENEFGSVEDIHLTYVVVKLWDERRLVVPTPRLLEQPFQNWTRQSADILGTVTLQVDYTTPIEKLRIELDRIVAEHPAWDRRVCKLQVTDTTDRAMVVRALVSAQNADKCFALRCDVREKLLRFLQELDTGSHLPRVRWDGGPGALG